MKFLTPTEIGTLHQVLIDSIYIKETDLRRVPLEIYELGTLCDRIQTDKPAQIFVPILCNELSKEWVADKLVLVMFLEYVRDADITLSQDARDFINHAIAKCQEWQAKKRAQQKSINNLLSKGRQESPQLAPVEQLSRIDRGAIVSYDLDRAMTSFKAKLASEGAFAFTVGGDRTVLEQYIIERIRRELSQKTGRKNDILEIHLINSEKEIDIEGEFLKRYQYDRFTDVFRDITRPDIVLIIWNHDIPQKIIKQLAKKFWEDTHASVLPYLQGRSRCFVTIWANVGKSYRIGFDILPIPKQFQLGDLSAWFRGQLIEAKLGNDAIERYIERLQNHCGELFWSYREMSKIIQEIQGGTRFYE